MLGPDRVRVRWWDFYSNPVETAALPEGERTTAFLAALQRHPERLTGRAATALAPLLPGRPAEAFRAERCARAVLHSRHVHIDPDGHIFPGTCAGIILGRAEATDSAAGTTVAEVWRRLAANWRQHPVVAPLAAGGPFQLLQAVLSLGYVVRPAGYADKCHLCADIRQWLVERDVWPQWLGPPACYGVATRATPATCGRAPA